MKNRAQLISENPFYGMQNLFALYQNGTKTISFYLTKAWAECDTIEKKQLFHSICFGIGDITNRKHNIFGNNKIDDGGNSANIQWLEYLNWLFQADKQQFIRFLPLMIEYVGLRELTTYQIKTRKFKKTIQGTFGLLKLIQSDVNVYEALLAILVKYIRGNNPFYKTQVAKFVHIPRYSKRQKTIKEGKKDGLRDLQSQTKEKMKVYQKLVTDLSERMSWLIEVKDKYTSFTGYRNWQKQYNGELEFVLFSTGKINEFDQEQFTNWLNVLPSGARYRVRRRLFDGDDKEKAKWSKLANWFKSWEQYKEQAQQEQRTLSEKAKTTGLTNEEKIKLQQVTKEAKVTTGAKTLFDYLNDFISGKADDLTVQSILDKVNFEVPVLVVADCSGSMNGRPTNIARLISTLALLKNPLNENLLFTFGSDCKVYTDGSVGIDKPNRFMTGNAVNVGTLVDKTKPFTHNYNNISKFVDSSSGSTNFASVAVKMQQWVDNSSSEVERLHKKEQINQYPVILVVTDGDLNSDRTQAESMLRFKQFMLQKFGWNGVVVLWDIPQNGDSLNKSGYYDNIEGVIHVTTYNLSTINQIFTKINDLDIIDVYTPLKSLFESNRYNLVKQATI